MKFTEKILDFLKVGEIRNAIIHKISEPDLDVIKTDIVNNESQIGYSQSIKRIVFNDGVELKILSTRDDIKNFTPTIYYQSTDPSSNINNILKQGDIWINSQGIIKVYNETNIVWDNTSASTFTYISDFSTTTQYFDKYMVMYQNNIYQNKTGTTLQPSTFNPLNWTKITNILSKISVEINENIPDNTTVGIITRIGNNFSILHSLNSNNIIIEGYDINGECYVYNYTKTSQNILTINFDIPVNESFFVNIYKI